MLDAATILAIAGTFLLAGAVKGVIGLGLPTVSDQQARPHHPTTESFTTGDRPDAR